MLGVVKNAVRIQRPVPAARGLKAEYRTPGEVAGSLRLLTLGRKFYAVFSQYALHFAEVSFAVVAEIFAYVFGSRPEQHCKDCLTALQVGWFMDVLNVHFSP